MCVPFLYDRRSLKYGPGQQNRRCLSVVCKSSTLIRAAHVNAFLCSTPVSLHDPSNDWLSYRAGWTAPIQVTVCLIILLVQVRCEPFTTPFL